MKDVRWNIWFYGPFAAAVLMGAVLLVMVEKGNEVLFLNRLHSGLLDNLFFYGTEFGNGLLYIAVIVALIWFSFRKAAVAMMCFSATGILVQFLKRIVFSDEMRPGVFFSGVDLHFVEGVNIVSNFSFPSGHSAIAFSLFCFLSLIVKDQRWGGLFIIMALIGAMSRVYLVLHFFIDVYVGAILGVLVTSLIWIWASKAHLITTSKWGDGSLLALLRR